MTGKRQLGLDNINDISWGAHFCNLYIDIKDFLMILVPYFSAGLYSNEKCIWITSNSFNSEEAYQVLDKYIVNFNSIIEKGQIEIIPYNEFYLKNGHFDKDRVIELWSDKLKTALDLGYDGLRISGSMDWVEESFWDKWIEYEKEIDAIISNLKIIAICNYSLFCRSGYEIADVTLNHNFSIINKDKRQRVVANSNKSAIVRELENKIFELENINKFDIDREKKISALNDQVALLNEEINRLKSNQ